MTKIGLIGTGMLGNAVGLHLLESGHELIVYNRTKEKTSELKNHGGKVVDSPKDVASLSELVIVCVKDAAVVKEISFGHDGIVQGNYENLVVADMSTINPNETKQISKQFKDSGITLLEIPVMGGPNAAIKGGLVLMASGNEEVFNKHKKVFETIAKQIFFLGQSGVAHSVKLAMNLQIAMVALAISEGIILARASSIDPETFLKILNSTYFKTGMSENKAYKMISDKFEPTFTMNNLKKDLNTINEAAKSFGVTLPMSTRAEEIYQKQ